MTIKRSLAYGLLECLGSTFPSDHFSDVTVVVEDATFKCHKVILNACSEFFQVLFRSNMRECQENRVTIGGMTADTFAVILSSLYTGEDGITEDNVLDVWAATVQLQIVYLIKECEQFVMDTLSEENCCVFLSYATRHSSSETLISYILKFMHNHFDNIRRDDSFLELNADDVYKVVKSNDLRTWSEDSVVECILKWLQYVPYDQLTSQDTQAEERKNNTVKLLSAVRLCLVSQGCLKDLSRQELVRSFPEACDMIDEALNYNTSVDKRHDAWPEAAIYRSHDILQHAMVFINGSTLMVYELSTGKFYEYAQISYPQNVSITVFDNELYVDNCTSLKKFAKKFAKAEIWQNMLLNSACLCPSSQSNILLPHGSYIYCYDTNLESLKRYNCMHGREKKWEMLNISMTDGSIVRFKQFILMFSTERDIVVIQCFDTINEKCVSLIPDNPMIGPTDNMVSFTDQKDVFILQKNGHLWKITSADSSLVDFTFIDSLWDFDWKIFGAVVFHAELFIFGNADGKVSKSYTNVQSAMCLETINKVNMVRIKSVTQCVPIVIPLRF